MQRWLKWFAVLTTIGMLLVLLGGALVTKTESGMGCGRSWPLCNGQLLPQDITAALIIELAHRMISGIVGLMVLILSIWSWKAIGHIRETKFLAFVSFIFLVLQGLIGAAAVMWGQSDFILALHFGISLISFSSVLLLTLLIFEVDKKLNTDNIILDSKLQAHIIFVTIYTYIVVYTGALVRHINASLVCRDWPFCLNDRITLPSNLHEWVQMGHRGAAGILFIWICYLLYYTYKHYRNQPIIYYSNVIAFILVFLQATAGALIIFTKQNLYIALSHAFFISCFIGVLSYLMLLTFRNRKTTK